MSTSEEKKCAIVVSESLTTGLAVNAAGVLSVSLGDRVDGLVGSDVKDAGGVLHTGVIYLPLPVLKASLGGVTEIMREVTSDYEVFCVSFSSLAQSCRTYGEYIERMSATSTNDLEIIGVALYGPKKRINKLVGSLPLLR